MPLQGLASWQILAGGATLSIAPYASNAGAFTGTSFGHTLTPTTWGLAFEDFDVETEQSIGRVKTLPVAANYTLKATLAQNDAQAMFIATRQNTSGFLVETTTATANLAFNDPVEVYYQLKLVGVGYGTTKVDTYRFWRCQVSQVADISYAKKGVQALEITFKILRDDTVTTFTTSGYYGFRAVA
jgi:hypothetical protein